jgi:hypothetical protein
LLGDAIIMVVDLFIFIGLKLNPTGIGTACAGMRKDAGFYQV